LLSAQNFLKKHGVLFSDLRPIVGAGPLPCAVLPAFRRITQQPVQISVNINNAIFLYLTLLNKYFQFIKQRGCVKGLLPPTAAKDFLNGGCVKRFLPPAAAEYYFKRHVILTISLREIVKMTCLSKYHSARSAVKNLFTQPPFKFNLARNP
jgi:hypothetical protein